MEEVRRGYKMGGRGEQKGERRRRGEKEELRGTGES